MLCPDTSRKTNEMFLVKNIFVKYFYFSKKTKIELLSSEQNERLFNFLNTRFESHYDWYLWFGGDPRTI